MLAGNIILGVGLVGALVIGYWFAADPSASVTRWTVGDARVAGTVTGGGSGYTDMHVQIKMTDKNNAVQHTYDLQSGMSERTRLPVGLPM